MLKPPFFILGRLNGGRCFRIFEPVLAAYEWQQGHYSGTLDRDFDTPLAIGACARAFSRIKLTLRRD